VMLYNLDLMLSELCKVLSAGNSADKVGSHRSVGYVASCLLIG
jgi:hypothetical protein